MPKINRLLLVSVACLAAVAACALAGPKRVPPAEVKTGQYAQVLETEATKAGRIEYWLYIPAGYAGGGAHRACGGVHPSNPKKWQGDYSEEGLKHNGFVLRNYVVLHAYADLVRKVLKP